jgi:hypothetical protein
MLYFFGIAHSAPLIDGHHHEPVIHPRVLETPLGTGAHAKRKLQLVDVQVHY